MGTPCCRIIKKVPYLRRGTTRAPSGLTAAGAEFLQTRGLPLGKWTGLAWRQAESSCRGSTENRREGGLWAAQLRRYVHRLDMRSNRHEIFLQKASKGTQVSISTAKLSLPYFLVFIETEHSKKRIMPPKRSDKMVRWCSLGEALKDVAVEHVTGPQPRPCRARTCIPRLDFITKNWSTSFLWRGLMS